MLLHPGEKIEGILIKIPLVHPFKTSFGVEFEKEALIVKVIKGDYEGWGEVVASRLPLYSEETISSCIKALEEFLFPIAKKCNFEAECFEKEAKKFKGNRMAKAGVSLALMDLKGKQEGKPLWKIYGGIRKEVPVGVSVGIQKSIDELLERISFFWEEGYLRVKIKIAPGWDVDVVKEIRKAFPQIPLGADANSAYTMDDFEKLAQLDPYELMFLEQPLYNDDLYFHSRLKKKIKSPIALDESITSARKLEEAFLMDSLSMVNIKVGRMGGINEVLKAVDFGKNEGIPFFCGGMLESGIGRAHNLHIASLPPFVLPADLSKTSRYFREDITPPFEFSSPGHIAVPDGDGIGVEVYGEKIEKLSVLRFSL